MNQQATPSPLKQVNDDHDIIYALRTAHQNQTQLNLMADQKANIIVGTIAIFLTIMFTRISSIDTSDKTLLMSIGAVVILELIALLLAILVIKPRTRWMNHKLDIKDMPNPLFFGFFSVYSEQDYVDHMMNKMTDNESARELILKDLYQIGLVLKRKFNLLKFAYTFAVAGILMGVVSVAYLIIPHTA